MDIKNLVKEWYYMKGYASSSHQMYITGNLSLKAHMETVRETEAIESKLFKILTDDYNVKYPYQEIPLDLDYVLKIVN